MNCFVKECKSSYTNNKNGNEKRRFFKVPRTSFFGLMRNCCGSNDHPDSTLFIQMYKLVSTYSLMKPSKGCNVSGGEVVDMLLRIKDMKDSEQRMEQWNDQIDNILDKGRNTELLLDAAKILEDHDCFKSTTSDYVLSYVAGFVARRAVRFTKFTVNGVPSTCEECSSSLILDETKLIPEEHKLILMRTKGYLVHPSENLFQLISLLERATLEVVQESADLDADTILRVTAAIENLSPSSFIGCKKHYLLLIHSVITFYLTTRMLFLCKQSNKNDCIEKEKTREKRKSSKLVTSSDYDGVKECYSKNSQCSVAVKKQRRPRKRKQKTLCDPLEKEISKKRKRVKKTGLENLPPGSMQNITIEEKPKRRTRVKKTGLEILPPVSMQNITTMEEKPKKRTRVKNTYSQKPLLSCTENITASVTKKRKIVLLDLTNEC